MLSNRVVNENWSPINGSTGTPTSETVGTGLPAGTDRSSNASTRREGRRRETFFPDGLSMVNQWIPGEGITLQYNRPQLARAGRIGQKSTIFFDQNGEKMIHPVLILGIPRGALENGQEDGGLHQQK